MPETRSSLLSRVRDLGDAEGWVEFDRLYRPLLIQYARARGLPGQDAEEIAQDCLSAVARAMHKFKRDKSFRGWLRGMVNRKVADHIADRRKHRRAGTEVLAAVTDPGPSPEALWQRTWNHAHLAYCLDTLRNEFAAHTLQSFVLYVLQEEPVDKIAATLGMTPNQVYVAKSRVMRRLTERSAEVLASLYGTPS